MKKLPIDGHIVSGNATLNEAAITGESVPASKSIDDRVFSGTIVDNGFIEVIADRVGDDTTFARIIELVEEAQESKSKTEKFLDRFANIYTPSIVSLICTCLYFHTQYRNDTDIPCHRLSWRTRYFCTCSIVAGIGNGARNGVLIKGGDIMENLAKIDTVVFDKTGTLTRGRPEVTDIHTFAGDENELLRLVAEAEMISEHHLGQTIVKEAKTRNLSFSMNPKTLKSLKEMAFVHELKVNYSRSGTAN